VLTLEQLRGHPLFGMRLIREPSDQPLQQRVVCSEYAAIEAAIRSSDETAARRAMVLHLEGGIIRLFGNQ
jgi:DNA-binding FadR family transcriptional regulator